MRRANAKCLCLILLAGFAARSAEQQAVLDDYKKKSAELKELVARINDALPNGWHAEFANDPCYTPTIEIRGDAVWAVQIAGINDIFGPKGANDSSGEDVEWVNPKFYLSYSKFMTREVFANQTRENSEIKSRRVRMQEQLLARKIDHVVDMGPVQPNRLYAPWEFKPKTEEEKELVRQYGILWEESDPVFLPTHYWKNMSFDYNEGMINGFFKNEEDRAELDKVKAKVLSLLTAYEPPKDEAKKP